MFHLTDDEVKSLGGGVLNLDTTTDEGTIPVDGYPDNPDPTEPIPTDPQDPEGPGGGGGGGGTGGPNNPINAPADWDTALDHSADAAANDVKNQIMQKSDHASREYGAFLYKDSHGVVHAGTLIAGTLTSIPAIGGKTAAELGIPSWNSVVGFVHNHPETSRRADGTIGPHDADYSKPDQGDWAFLITFTNPNLGADPSNLRQYIVNTPDAVGSIHEYDLFENWGSYGPGDTWRGSVESTTYDPF